MKLLSKKELEMLNDEYKNISNSYICKERIIAQIFAIKIYNLMKDDCDIASNYINRIFNISSICENINLDDYNISDIKMFLTIDNNILSGFIFGPKKNENTYFSNVIQIKNDFILTIPQEAPRPLFLENLIKELNLTCLISLSKNLIEELNKRIEEKIDDRFAYNMYIEHQFRKNEFLNLPLSKNEKILLIKHYYINDRKNISEPCVEKYISDMFKDQILEYASLHIHDIVKNLKISMSNKILDIDCLYEQILADIDELTINLLNTPIYESISRNKPLIVLDWLIIKDDIFDFIKKKIMKYI